MHTSVREIQIDTQGVKMVKRQVILNWLFEITCICRWVLAGVGRRSGRPLQNSSEHTMSLFLRLGYILFSWVKHGWLRDTGDVLGYAKHKHTLFASSLTKAIGVINRYPTTCRCRIDLMNCSFGRVTFGRVTVLVPHAGHFVLLFLWMRFHIHY